MTSQPWMKFFFSDWQSDQGLGIVSLASRGLWLEMLGIMHRAEPYGHLLVNGKKPSDEQLAALARAPADQIRALTHELEEAGVFSRTRNGTIYSRRMTRDEKKRLDGEKSQRNGRITGSRRYNQAIEKQQQNLPPPLVVDKPPSTHMPEAREEREESKKEEANASLSERGPQPSSSSVLNFPLPQAPRPDADKTPVAVPALPLNPSGHDLALAGMTVWNEVFADQTLPRISKIDGAREKAFLARLNKDLGGNLYTFTTLCIRVRSSPHLTGCSNGGWRASFDWCMEPRNFTKIVEGNYDERHSQVSRAKPAGNRAAILRGLADATVRSLDTGSAGHCGAG